MVHQLRQHIIVLYCGRNSTMAKSLQTWWDKERVRENITTIGTNPFVQEATFCQVNVEKSNLERGASHLPPGQGRGHRAKSSVQGCGTLTFSSEYFNALYKMFSQVNLEKSDLERGAMSCIGKKGAHEGAAHERMGGIEKRGADKHALPVLEGSCVHQLVAPHNNAET